MRRTSRELNRRLSYHASHDILTGLVNRREFENRLERALDAGRAPVLRYAASARVKTSSIKSQSARLTLND